MVTSKNTCEVATHFSSYPLNAVLHCARWCYTVQKQGGVTLCNTKVVLHCERRCYTVKGGVTLCKVVLHCVRRCYTVQGGVTLCKVVLHCARRCCTVQGGVTLCKVVLHCARWCFRVTCLSTAQSATLQLHKRWCYTIGNVWFLVSQCSTAKVWIIL